MPSGDRPDADIQAQGCEAKTIDRICDQFEQAWGSGQQPGLADYLARLPDTADSITKRSLLVELVMIDLERRWQDSQSTSDSEDTTAGTMETAADEGGPASARPLVEDYLGRYPALGPLDRLPLDLAAYEYRVRHLWGDRPAHEDYLRRFPAMQANLEHLLARVDRELASVRQSARRQSSETLPRKVGRYELIERLGRGGMGTVYKAVHTRLKRKVAVKLLRRELLEDENAVLRFQREMEAVGRLNHPNLVQALDADNIGGTHVLVMEYVEGVDLAKILNDTGRLSIDDACEIIRQAAEGLQHAHEKGLVHRDVNPSNLMLTPDGVVKVMDLGLARLRRGQLAGEELTVDGQAVGTADYVAPEQVSDSRHVDIRADIYSLGCTLYEFLAGRAPFDDPHHRGHFAKMRAHLKESPLPVRGFRPDVPDQLQSILRRMLSKDPAERYPTPLAVASELEPFCTNANLQLLWSDSVAAATTDPESADVEGRGR